MKILGINGIRSHGRRNTDQLLLRLAEFGWPVKDVNYPKVNLLEFWARGHRWHRDRQYRDAGCLIRAQQSRDAVIAHSYGCLLVLRAMERGAHFSVVFLFSPALDKDVTFPKWGADRIYVIHNPRDKAISLATLLHWHDSGAMGRVGYQGPPDSRVVNESVTDAAGGWLHHSDYFLPERIERWAMWLDTRLWDAGLRR